MIEVRPETRIVEIVEAERAIADLIAAVRQGKGRILIEEDGVPVAALLAEADLARLDRLDRAWAERSKALASFGAAFADVSVAELETRVARIVTQGAESDGPEPDRRSP